MTRIAIVGSRDYPDLQAVRDYVAGLPDGTVIISGGARGVDQAAEEAAAARGFEIIVYLPNWQRHGKRAGFLRNEQIVADADEVVAFWDGVSRGTKSTITIASRDGKPVTVNPHKKD